jgi:hypothetical protein
MNRPAVQSLRRRRSALRKKREGAALLIVLFVLMMATGTAVFAMQSTQFEQRAAGSLQVAMRTKFVAEAATVSVLALCFQLGPTGCADLKRADNNFAGALRERYGLPDYVVGTSEETVYSLGTADLPPSFVAPVLPTDTQLADTGTASAFRPGFTSVMEKWDVPNPGETRERFRLIVSTFGQLSYDVDGDGVSDDVQHSTELRGAHESISATRAFLDVR